MATLEILAAGLAEGLSDLGAAGITCGVAETADSGRDRYPGRPGRDPSPRARHGAVRSGLSRIPGTAWSSSRGPTAWWGTPRSAPGGCIACTVIGRVTVDGDITVVEGGLAPDGRPGPGTREIARIPARALASDAIVLDRLAAPPARRRLAPAPGVPESVGRDLPERGMDPGAVLLGLLGGPNLASRAWVAEQYDRHVGTNTVGGLGHGAAALRVKGTSRALVVTTDCNQAVSAIDPHLGAQLSVAEAARNVSITGARPLGVTNCLNFGDRTRPESFWQLREAVRGLGDACRALGLPVTGGNVASLYNEAPGSAIAPTPEIGIVGLLDDVTLLVGPAFGADGDLALLRGPERARPRGKRLRGPGQVLPPRTTCRAWTLPRRPPARPSSARRSPPAS